MQGRAPLPPTPLSRPREEGDGGCLDGKWEEAEEDGRAETGGLFYSAGELSSCTHSH